MDVVILGSSVLLQLTAALAALRLIRTTNHPLGWGLIAAAVTLMAARRLITFRHLLAGDPHAFDPVAESVALMISILMLGGILVIGSLFRAIKRAESALRDSEYQQRMILSSIDEIVYVIEPDDKASGGVHLTFVSPKVETIAGWTPGELVADPGLRQHIIHPEDWPSVAASTREVLESGRTGIREYRLRRKSGEWRWFEDHLAPRIGEDGRVTGAFGVARDTTRRREAEMVVERSREQLRSLATRLQAVREEERASIAREMHDELGQSLTAAKLDLSWVVDALPPEATVARERGRSLLGLVDATITTIRSISTRLRPAVLDDLGLAAAAEWQAEEVARRTGIRITFNSTIGEVSLDRTLATALFRILQESLTNVVRHADASLVTINLTVEDDDILLEIEDDGRGIREDDITNPTSLGLLGIRERAATFGGTVDFSRRAEGGTRVLARVPAAASAPMGSTTAQR